MQVPSNGPDEWGERLPRSVGLWGTVAVLVGTTIGSGIFRVPASVAALLQQPGPVLLVWVLGGVVALCGALSLAELAGAWPRSGGIFAYILEAFGPLPAFLFGWTELAVVRASALGATSSIFAEYLGYFVPLKPAQMRWVAAITIVAVGAMNYLGMRRAALVMAVATAAKSVAVVGLGLLAFTAAGQGWTHFHPLWNGGVKLSLLATALVPVMWTYDGWADGSFIGGEVRDPQRTLPLALMLGTAVVVTVYLLVNLGLMYVLPSSAMAASKLIASDAAMRIPLFAGWGVAAVTGMVLLSTFSGLNGSMMTGSRVFFAMADRGLFFKGLARISPRFQSPSAAIALTTVLSVVYVLRNDFAQLADRFILGIWPFYALAVLAVFVLRHTRATTPRPYKVWGYPWVPGLFLLASLGMVANALRSDPVNTGFTFAIIAAGIPSYFLWRLFKARVRTPRQDRYPV